MSDLQVFALGNLAANGSTPWHQITGSDRSPTGSVNIRSTGNFGGGTLTYEGSRDAATSYSLGANAVFTDAGGAEVRLVEGEYVRATLSGAAGPDIDTDILLPGTD